MTIFERTAGMERWVAMWSLAGVLFAGVKASTWLSRPVLRRVTPWPRALLYLFGWPGMDAAAFCSPARVARPVARRWVEAIAKTALGATLLWAVARQLPGLASGWCGMTGLIFLLHFGTFDLLTLAYRAAGIPAEPIMRNPALARSVAEFWGVRWNRGFRDWAHRQIFRPAERRLGPAGATMWTYLVSGLLHELVITVPAGGGYGGPTVYFLLQGAGAMAERTTAGRSWLRGRLFTLLVTAGPAYWLFPPVFVERVMLPFMEAIGAR